MQTEKIDAWRDAEREATLAALELEAALAVPGSIPGDHLFERVWLLRRRANEALGELMSEYERECVRLTAPVLARASRSAA